MSVATRSPTCGCCGAPLTEAFVARLWSRIDRRGDDECWPWLGRRDAHGYGVIDHARARPHLVHRVVWELTHGPIPRGIHVLHRCDRPACCNPGCLFLGTHADNMADMWAKGRGRHFVGIGEANPNALLTDAKVREIRRLYAEGAGSQSAIASMFGVTRAAVCDVVIGRSWRHVS